MNSIHILAKFSTWLSNRELFLCQNEYKIAKYPT